MSRYQYAGPFKNPTEGFFVKSVGEKWEIWIRFDRESDGSCKADRRHKTAPRFEDQGDALDWIDDLRQSVEEDYDQYLDEHHDEIAAMERYEAFRNEY